MDTATRIHTVWQGVFAEALPSVMEAEWASIKKSYDSNGRYYHNLEHLGYMLNLLEATGASPQDPTCLRAAILYHDVVYAVNNKGNETKSAKRAQRFLTGIGWPDERVARCVRHIQATAKHNASADSDTALLLDLDLAILGDAPAAYDAYASNIRREYRRYPDFLYRRGRAKMLQFFLAKPEIYRTAAIREQREVQARRNLSRELDGL